MSGANDLIDFFNANCNASLSPAMEKYMLGQFSFLGIKSPERKQLLRQFLQNYGYPDAAHLEAFVKQLWQTPGRELHYAAMEIASRKTFLKDSERIILIEWMIAHESWWDTVDFIASNMAGVWFKLHPQEILPVTSRWMASGNIWLQRTCLLFQLKYRHETDAGLLFGFIEQLASEKEFFIRKAIGWALREYSKTEADEVMQFVETHTLSPLSRREALKVILKRAIP
jgi:3-methyladenine DNA glycosylase AlkD